MIEDPGRVEGFKLGAWVFVINRGEDGDKFKLAETLDTEALLLGPDHLETFEWRGVDLLWRRKP